MCREEGVTSKSATSFEVQFIIPLKSIHHKQTIHAEKCVCSLEGGK